MRVATITVLTMLLVSSTAVAQSSQTGLRARTTPGDALTNPNSPAAHNPGVNPSSAGTQMNWQGYGATSEAARSGSSTAPQYNRTDERPLKPRDLRNQRAPGPRAVIAPSGEQSP